MEVKWTSLDGKELQQVHEKLNIKTVMEAIGNENAEGIDELWGVSCINVVLCQ